MRALRRWHPWRRRLRGWVLRGLDWWLPLPPEPRPYRAQTALPEVRLRQRMAGRIDRQLNGHPEPTVHHHGTE
jgi:hypothetical protein